MFNIKKIIITVPAFIIIFITIIFGFLSVYSLITKLYIATIAYTSALFIIAVLALLIPAILDIIKGEKQ